MLLSFFIVSIITYLAISFFGYIVHFIIHRPWAGKLYKQHQTHHQLYTSKNFSSDQYRSAGKDNSVFIFLPLALPLLILPLILAYLHIIPIFLAVLSIVEMFILGFLHDFFHDAFHLNNHFLHRFSVFQYLVSIHRIHHKRQGKNYSIFGFFLFDRIFRTYQRTEHLK